jgi:hypothetical protein
VRYSSFNLAPKSLSKKSIKFLDQQTNILNCSLV